MVVCWQVVRCTAMSVWVCRAALGRSLRPGQFNAVQESCSDWKLCKGGACEEGCAVLPRGWTCWVPFFCVGANCWCGSYCTGEVSAVGRCPGQLLLLRVWLERKTPPGSCCVAAGFHTVIIFCTGQGWSVCSGSRWYSRVCIDLHCGGGSGGDHQSLQRRRPGPERNKRSATWLILPVVIRSSQRLSHACLSITRFT